MQDRAISIGAASGRARAREPAPGIDQPGTQLDRGFTFEAIAGALASGECKPASADRDT
jgi:hypothetical protein